MLLTVAFEARVENAGATGSDTHPLTKSPDELKSWVTRTTYVDSGTYSTMPLRFTSCESFA